MQASLQDMVGSYEQPQLRKLKGSISAVSHHPSYALRAGVSVVEQECKQWVHSTQSKGKLSS
jgi:hypothetical protein